MVGLMAGKALVAKYLLDPSGVKSGVGAARTELGKLDDDTGKLASGVDKASSRMGSAFQGIGNSLESLGVPFAGSIGKFGEKLDEADTHGKSFFQTLSGVGGAAMLGIGAAAVAAGAEGVKLAEGFDTATGQIASSAGISEKAAKDIGTAFLNTAGTTTFSGTQIAQAYAGVAGQLGTTEGHALDAHEALDVMTASMNLAEATGTSLGTSTGALSGVMQAFGLDTKQAAGASDVLFNSARSTGVGVDAVAATFQKLHSTLGAVSPDIGQLGGMLVDLANHGETGRKALSAVNTALNGLLTPTSAAKTAQQELGVSVFDSSGKFVGFSNLIGQLQPKLAGMSQQQQLATLKALGFGTANKALLTTIMSGPQAYDAASAAVTRSKSAHEGAEKATDNLRGQTEKLKATAEDLGTKLGEALIPKIELVAQKTSEVIGWFMKHKGAAEALAGVVGGVLAVAMGAFAINTGVQMVKSLQSAGEAVGKLGATMLEKLVPTSAAVSEAFAAEGEAAESSGAATDAAFGPIGLILAGVAIAATLLVTHWKQVSKFLSDIWHGISSTAKTVWDDVSKFFKKWGEDLLLVFLPVVGIPLYLATHWRKVEDDAKAIWGDITSFLSSIPGKILGFFTGALSWLDHVGHDIMHGLWTGVKDEWSALGSIGKTIEGWFIAGIGTTGKWLDHVGHQILHGLWQGVVDEWTGLGSIGKTILGWFIAGIGAVDRWLYQIGHLILRGLWTGLKDEWTGLGNIGSTLLGWFLAGIGAVGKWLDQTGHQILHGLWQGLVDEWNGLGDIGKTVEGWFTSGLSNAVSWLVQTGKDIVTGLWNGISSMGTWLYNQVTGFATSFVKNAIHDALSIFSPSRVTFQSGVYVAQGLAQGILSGAGIVEAASRHLANSATTGLDGLGGSTFKVGASSGLGSAPMATAVPGTTATAGATVNVYVTVEGNVATEKQLADYVRMELLNHAQVNGTIFGVNT